jgi:flagellar hook assembly protein FlgD
VNLGKRSNVTINIYDLKGRFIKKVTSQAFDAGHYDFSWKPYNKSNGIYIIERIIDQKKYQNKVVYLK